MASTTVALEIRVRKLLLATLAVRLLWPLPRRAYHAIVRRLWARARFEFRIGQGAWQRLPQPELTFG